MLTYCCQSRYCSPMDGFWIKKSIYCWYSFFLHWIDVQGRNEIPQNVYNPSAFVHLSQVRILLPLFSCMFFFYYFGSFICFGVKCDEVHFHWNNTHICFEANWSLPPVVDFIAVFKPWDVLSSFVRLLSYLEIHYMSNTKLTKTIPGFHCLI